LHLRYDGVVTDRRRIREGRTAMLIDRYAPVNLFALVPKLVVEFEPELRELDRLLDDDLIVQRVRADLARRAPQTLTRGRPSPPVEVILRLLVVKRLYDWSYAEVEHFVSDSLTLRQFCRLYLEPVPDDTTLIRWANLLGPETVRALHERVVALARSLTVTRGRKLRVDSTVVETTIHYPTDSRLLGDGVRVLSRLRRRATGVVAAEVALPKPIFQSHTRSVRQLAQQVHRVARRKGEQAAEELQEAYRKLIDVTAQPRTQAKRVCGVLRGQADAQAARLVAQFAHVLPLVDQAIDQAPRRVLAGEVVPAKDKLLSLFEPHTQVITRHKPGKPVAFGRTLWLEEVAGGIVSGDRVLEEAGQDYPYLAESVEQHQERFGHPPWLVAGDRGVSSPDNVHLAEAAGVRRVALPHTGRASPARRERERQRWFRRGQRFRAGIEGRSRVLKRDYGLDRCPDHGLAGLERWVGWGIVTHNLHQIAQTLSTRSQ
jgi:IS5 family transposase